MSFWGKLAALAALCMGVGMILFVVGFFTTGIAVVAWSLSFSGIAAILVIVASIGHVVSRAK